MNVKDFSLTILVNFLLLFNEIISYFDASISVINMPICQHVHTCDEPADYLFILEAAFVLNFRLSYVVNVEPVILFTILGLTFQEKDELLGNFIVTEFNHIISYRVFSEDMFDFIF